MTQALAVKQDFLLGGRKRTAQVMVGDIRHAEADAMITAINSGGMWAGGIDRALYDYVGNIYHSQAAAAMPLKNLDTVVATFNGRGPRTPSFGDVVFVVDDLKGPVRDVIEAGLAAASSAGYKTICMPAIRTGVMLGVVERSAIEAVTGLLTGVRDFFARNPHSPIEHLTFVVYGDSSVARELGTGFSRLLNA